MKIAVRNRDRSIIKLVRYPSFSPFASAYSLYNASVLDKLDTSWRLYFAVAAMTVVGRIPPIVPMHMRHVMIAAMIRWRISFVFLFISLLLVLSSITTAILFIFSYLPSADLTEVLLYSPFFSWFLAVPSFLCCYR